jgi:hypothetical protein
MIRNTATGKVMAMHQPNYIPWLGYFYKMAQADVFVYLDAVQYPRGKSVSARNEIKTPQGKALLTVPLSIPGNRDGKAMYTEIGFAGDKWRQKHVRSLEMNYRKAPYFDDIHPMLLSHITKATTLLELNLGIIEDFADYLGIATNRVRMSSLGDGLGNKSELIVNLCRATGAKVYLSGSGGGREYNDEAQLAEAGIELEYSAFTHPEYRQLWGAFERGLSALDALYNLGRDARSLIGLAN